MSEAKSGKISNLRQRRRNFVVNGSDVASLHPAACVVHGGGVHARSRRSGMLVLAATPHYSAARLRARISSESCPHSVGTTSYLLRHIATIGVVQLVLRDARGTAQRSTFICAGQRGAVRVGGGAACLLVLYVHCSVEAGKRRRDHSLGRLETIELERAVLCTGRRGAARRFTSNARTSGRVGAPAGAIEPNSARPSAPSWKSCAATRVTWGRRSPGSGPADPALQILGSPHQREVRARLLARLQRPAPGAADRRRVLRRAAGVGAGRRRELRYVRSMAGARGPDAAGQLDGGEFRRRRDAAVLRRAARVADGTPTKSGTCRGSPRRSGPVDDQRQGDDEAAEEAPLAPYDAVEQRAWFAVLGVSPFASIDEIKDAYKALVKRESSRPRPQHVVGFQGARRNRDQEAQRRLCGGADASAAG